MSDPELIGQLQQLNSHLKRLSLSDPELIHQLEQFNRHLKRLFWPIYLALGLAYVWFVVWLIVR
jgi:hypothetical protein